MTDDEAFAAWWLREMESAGTNLLREDIRAARIGFLAGRAESQSKYAALKAAYDAAPKGTLFSCPDGEQRATVDTPYGTPRVRTPRRVRLVPDPVPGEADETP